MSVPHGLMLRAWAARRSIHSGSREGAARMAPTQDPSASSKSGDGHRIVQRRPARSAAKLAAAETPESSRSSKVAADEGKPPTAHAKELHQSSSPSRAAATTSSHHESRLASSRLPNSSASSLYRVEYPRVKAGTPRLPSDRKKSYEDSASGWHSSNVEGAGPSSSPSDTPTRSSKATSLDPRGSFAALASSLRSMSALTANDMCVPRPPSRSDPDAWNRQSDDTGKGKEREVDTAGAPLEFQGNKEACRRAVDELEASLSRWTAGLGVNQREATINIDEALQLYFSACSRLGEADAPPQSMKAVRALVSCRRLWPSWYPRATTHQAINDYLLQHHDTKATAFLAKIARRQNEHRTLYERDSRILLRLCVSLLSSPSLLDRRRGKSTLIQALSRQKDPSCSFATLSLRTALLANFCRAAEGWAKDPAIVPLALGVDALIRRNTIRMQEQGVGDREELLEKAWLAVVAWRALKAPRAKTPDSSFPALDPDLVAWAKDLHKEEVPRIAGLDRILHSILFRAQVERGVPSAHQHAEGYQQLLRSIDDLGFSGGALSWRHAIEALLGSHRAFMRPYEYRSRAARFTAPSATQSQAPFKGPDLIQLYEASLLYEASIRASKPAIALAPPLIDALLCQFPPRIERAMEIYRQTQASHTTRPVVSGHGWRSLSRLAFFRRPSEVSSTVNADDEVDSIQSLQQTAALAKSLLDFLLKRDDPNGPPPEGPELQYAIEIVKDLIAQGRGSSLSQLDRQIYTVKILVGLSAHGRRRVAEQGRHTTSEDDFTEALDFWNLLIGQSKDRDVDLHRPNSASRLAASTATRVAWSSWLDDIHNGALRDIAMALAGRGLKSEGSPSRDWREAPFALPPRHKYVALPLAPLSIVVDCILRTIKPDRSARASGSCISLLTQFAQLATYSAHYRMRMTTKEDLRDYIVMRCWHWHSDPPPDHASLSSAIHRLGVFHLHSVVPDTPVIGAYMEASNRIGDYATVFELWQGLLLSTINERNRETGFSNSTSNSAGSLPRQQQQQQQQQQQRLDFTGVSARLPAADRPAINSAIVSILLDAKGWCGEEETGRRAWALVGRLDEGRQVDDKLRNVNVWTSWLEFLCRCGRLSEALGDQGLDAMLVGSNPRPNAKTLTTVLSFALRKDLEEGAARARLRRTMADWDDKPATGPTLPRATSEGGTAFQTLRERIQRGDYGQGMWEEIVSERPDMMKASL
ncbi:hypothetical protein BDZ90DRAFT_187164 [Jaminaea rosea]|uniref:Uncharacterized protein n=1 Tax=Jaminaea rosea TaxID=1569628 RepID=A0A316UPD4_9BASI|nr:hypothetical protein BDZ90DRAFT_187164 [Jaminaea rosea]PWN27157.1 hypothetical protein BDZ90DRAFT_187164 [Jaminaea rosea]